MYVAFWWWTARSLWWMRATSVVFDTRKKEGETGERGKRRADLQGATCSRAGLAGRVPRGRFFSFGGVAPARLDIALNWTHGPHSDALWTTQRQRNHSKNNGLLNSGRFRAAAVANLAANRPGRAAMWLASLVAGRSRHEQVMCFQCHRNNRQTAPGSATLALALLLIRAVPARAVRAPPGSGRSCGSPSLGTAGPPPVVRPSLSLLSAGGVPVT
jgi:hypothetical protein